MTHFLPARIEWEGRRRVTHRSGKAPAISLRWLANGFLIVGPERPQSLRRWVDVLPRRGHPVPLPGEGITDQAVLIAQALLPVRILQPSLAGYSARAT
jgi:hypothetical protein